LRHKTPATRAVGESGIKRGNSTSSKDGNTKAHTGMARREAATPAAAPEHGPTIGTRFSEKIMRQTKNWSGRAIRRKAIVL
jgi:hypothetical protein